MAKNKDWENDYPLSTFIGKTKEELIEFIRQQRIEAAEEAIKACRTNMERDRELILRRFSLEVKHQGQELFDDIKIQDAIFIACNKALKVYVKEE